MTKSEKHENDILAKIDECLVFLKNSPSEATVRKAAELEGYILKWREGCVSAMFKNATEIAKTFMESLGQIGIKFDIPTEKKGDGK